MSLAQKNEENEKEDETVLAVAGCRASSDGASQRERNKQIFWQSCKGLVTN